MHEEFETMMRDLLSQKKYKHLTHNSDILIQLLDECRLLAEDEEFHIDNFRDTLFTILEDESLDMIFDDDVFIEMFEEIKNFIAELEAEGDEE